ncbi:peptidoglycan-binding protein [Streptomyces peucetius]|uniref:Peptidoglycan-binding protein n=1 Tax=Streptomyces peucetius TaxID=1950 RepID=A0ABY6IJH7_STRPE|nr:peptidoglycan-binding protein [Streptomyces peucetius]UYQ66315.1 peptidoglycan-binding protein [Streptomyces peucetius]
MRDNRRGTDSAHVSPEETMRLAAVRPLGDVEPYAGRPGDGAVTESSADPVPVSRGRSARRRRTAVGVAVVLLATGGAATGTVLWPDGGAERAAAEPQQVELATVSRTTLSESLSLPGNLGYGAQRTLHPYGGGRVTWLPEVGATIKRGQTIWRVDDRPVVLLYGDTPVFRPLDRAGLVGRDVRVIADHLRSLGYDIGAQLPEGTWVRSTAASSSSDPSAREADATTTAQPSTAPSPSASDGGSGTQAEDGRAKPSTTLTKVRKGDAVLTPSLIAAIGRWQRSQDMDPSGVIRPAEVFVTSGGVRVGKVLAQVGDDTSTGLISVTSTGKQVTLAVHASEAGSVREDARVRVTLPDQRQVHGTVTSVGTVVQDDEADNPGRSATAGRVAVTVRLDSDDEVRRLDSAPVQVEFPGQTKRDVLAVPVGALLALSEGGYALRTEDGRLVAVETGMFAKGMVEVTGSGLREGLRVETAS